MGNPLRDRRTPLELAASGQLIEFEEKISKFERLASAVKDDLETLDPDNLPGDWRDAVVTGSFSFGFADAHKALPKLEGEVATTIDAVCQRCLGPMRLPLSVELRLLFGGDESTVADEGGFEVWELQEERVRPCDIVEESLLMALPLAAVHVDDATCKAADAPAVDAGEERTRPFADLKAQMGNGIE